MAQTFNLISKTIGYISKPDKTNTSRFALVDPSQNVLINDEEKIATRGGYTLFGAANASVNAIEGSIDWKTSGNTTLNLRSYDDELEVFIGTVNSIAFNSWERLLDGWTAVAFSFDAWWSTSEGIDLLLWVNGSDKIWEWPGAITTFLSATSNTLKKQGTNTWAQDRFLVAGTRKVRIKDTGGTWREFTYTGGESTTTLTGVTPDPTGFTFAAGALAIQSVRENDNQPADGYVGNILRVLNNQVYVGSNENREVFVSKNTSFIDYTFATPRAAGEGGLLTLDNVARAFARQDREMLISAGEDDWYSTRFVELDIGGSLKETIHVDKLNTSSGQAARSQELLAEIGNNVAYIDFNNQLRVFGRIQELENPAMKALSDQIKPDFDAADFTGGHVFFHKNRIYISAPNDDKVYINETRESFDGLGNQILKRFWQPPQILPVRRFSVVSGDIHGHSNAVPETYKLFDGTNDNSLSFAAKAAFSYRNYGKRGRMKTFDEWLTEGYIRANTILSLMLNYDFDGFTQSLEFEIDGSDEDILFEAAGSGSLGDNPLGDIPLGDQPNESSQLPKFRIIHEMSREDFYEIQAIYSSDDIDRQWELLAHGGAIQFSKNQGIFLKK